MSWDCFISNVSADLTHAEELHRRLAGQGFAVWFDKARLDPGCNWYQEIKRGADAARIILPVLTPRWKQSEWAKFETYAGECVIPLLFEGDWSQVSTPPLRPFQSVAIDYSGTDTDAWNRLVKAIREQLSRPPPEKLERLSNVPYHHNPYFVGREKEMLQIHETLHQHPTTALTQGKVHAIAALAREFVEAFWRCYPQVFWLDCLSTTSYSRDVVRRNLALLWRSQGRLDDAEPLLVEALQIWRAAHPAGHPDIARGLNNLALLRRFKNG